jgi:hypothetical protein
MAAPTPGSSAPEAALDPEPDDPDPDPHTTGKQQFVKLFVKPAFVKTVTRASLEAVPATIMLTSTATKTGTAPSAANVAASTNFAAGVCSKRADNKFGARPPAKPNYILLSLPTADARTARPPARPSYTECGLPLSVHSVHTADYLLTLPSIQLFSPIQPNAIASRNFKLKCCVVWMVVLEHRLPRPALRPALLLDSLTLTITLLALPCIQRFHPGPAQLERLLAESQMRCCVV